jgi:hypothetical protein
MRRVRVERLRGGAVPRQGLHDVRVLAQLEKSRRDVDVECLFLDAMFESGIKLFAGPYRETGPW